MLANCTIQYPAIFQMALTGFPLKDTPGALTFNVKDQFPKFIKAATEWIPLPYWWAFEFAIILGFVNALCRRMS